MEIWHTKEEKPEVATGFAEASLLIKRDNSYGVWYQIIAFYEFEEYKNVIIEWCTIADLLALEQQLLTANSQIELLVQRNKELKVRISGRELEYETACEVLFEKEQQLQAKEEEIKELTKVVKMYRESDFQETVTDLENNNKSLQAKLQQAKEGLEFYAKAKHFEEHSHYDIMLEWGEKARETLEMINKE